MREFFIVAQSFAAPFVSDESTRHVAAEDEWGALSAYVAEYRHPAGLYSAGAYESADAWHKGAKPLLQWWSNKAEYDRQNKTVPLGTNAREGAFVS